MFPIGDSVRRKRVPKVTLLLILANVLVFLHELSLPADELQVLVHDFGVVPARIRAAWERGMSGLLLVNGASLFSSLFLHAGWIHIIGNMWFLWVFGDNVEDRMGGGRFLLFYLLCGIAADLAHIFTNLDSTVPVIGASGAVAGVMGGYLLFFPRARVLTLIPIFFWPVFIEVSAVFFILFWFLIQLWSGTLALGNPDMARGIAWWAHVGGFGAGFLLCTPLDRRRRRQND